MNTDTITVEYLQSLNACEDAIDFVKRNNLEGFPLSRLDEIKDDYNDYLRWLKWELKVLREYDSNGNMILVIDPYGAEFRYEYDQFGNMILEVYPNGDELRYEHDRYGNMIRKVNSVGGKYRYEYDQYGNMILAVFPSGNEDHYPFEHYPNGQLKRACDMVVPLFS